MSVADKRVNVWKISTRRKAARKVRKSKTQVSYMGHCSEKTFVLQFQWILQSTDKMSENSWQQIFLQTHWVQNYELFSIFSLNIITGETSVKH